MSDSKVAILDYEPFHHYYWLKKVLLKDITSAGGIALTTEQSAKAAVFEVLKAGPGYFDPVAGKRMPMSAAVGDYVVVSLESVVDLMYVGLGQGALLVCPDTAVLGKVKVTSPQN